MHELANPVDAVPCDCCGCGVGALWYQISVEEWYFDCRSRNGYTMCEICFPKLAQLLWQRRASDEFSDWVERQSTTD